MRPLISLTLSIGCGAAMLAAAAVALSFFSKAEWFTDPGPYLTTWEGYTKSDFAALVFFTFLTPPGFTLLYTGLIQASKIAPASSIGLRTLLVSALLVVLSVIAGLGSVWGSLILRCGGVFCVDREVWRPLDPPQAEAGMGWLACIGCSALFSCGPLVVAVALAHLLPEFASSSSSSRNGQKQKGEIINNGLPSSSSRGIGGIGGGGGGAVYSPPVQTPALKARLDSNGDYYIPDEDDEDENTAVRKPLMATAAHYASQTKQSSHHDSALPAFHASSRRDVLLLTLYLFLLTLFFFTTTTVPNSWEYFGPDKIADFARKLVAKNYDECEQWNPYICPEMDGAYMRTIGITLSGEWTLKLFPGNLMLYLFLAIVPSCSLLFRWQMSGVMRRKVWVWGRGVTIAEMMMGGGVGLLVALWTVYWTHDHNYNTYWPDQIGGIFQSEIIGRMLGQVAVLLMSLLMFPASRSILSWTFFGVSWEAGIEYHRWLGILFMLASIGHMIANYVWFSQAGEFPQDMMTVPMHLSTSIDNFTVPLVSLVLWLSLITFGVLAVFSTFRRRFFELFYYTHHITYCLMIPAVLWHAAAGWEYLLPGIGLWFADRVLRAYRSAKAAKIVSIRAVDCGVAGRVTEVRLSAPHLSAHYPGQFVFVNVAELSLFQWHPFTIASASTEHITLLIKDMGPKTWTSQLYDRTRDASGGIAAGGVSGNVMRSMTISVDGPYGAPIDYSKFRNILVVAGGIGITPARSIVQSIAQQSRAGGALDKTLERAHLLWMARDQALFSQFGNPILHACTQVPCLTATFAYTPRTQAALEEVVGGDEEGGGLNGGGRVKVVCGRPDVRSALLNAVAEPGTGATHLARGDKTLLFVCGPTPLTKMCERLAAAEGWVFHEECFEL